MRLIIILCVLIGAALPSPSASAHAALTESSPSEGSVLTNSPKRLVLNFNEPVSPLLLKLFGPNGSVTDLKGAVWTHDGLAIPLASELERGTHLLSWHVISQDGHPIGGSLSFSVGATGGRVTPAPLSAPGLDPLIWACRLALFACLFVGIGATFFHAWFEESRSAPPFVTKTIELALLSIAPLAVASLGLLGVDALAASWSAFASSSTWRAAFASTYSFTAALSIVASLLALVSLRKRQFAAQICSSLALLTAAAALAASGHAATAPPQWASRPAIFIHALCLIFWLGALLPLAGAFASARPGRVKSLLLFSTMIPWVVGALALTGVLLAVLQLRSWDGLLSSLYGRVLLLKVALVGLLLAVAAYNRFRLTPRLMTRDIRADSGFVRSIGIELFIALLILGVVALWRFTPPPRTMAEFYSGSIAVHLHDPRLMANVTISPGKVGANAVTVQLLGPDQRPLPARELRVGAGNEQAAIQPIRRAAKPEGPGLWKVEEMTMPVPGRWTLSLDVLIDDFTSVQVDGSFALRP